MQANLHSVSPISVVYNSGLSRENTKSTLSVSLAIVLGIFLVSPAGMVYTYDKVLRSTLPMSPVVEHNSPSV